VVLSATGTEPNFACADVAAMIAARGGGGTQPGQRRWGRRRCGAGAGGGARIVASGAGRARRAGKVTVRLRLRAGVRSRTLRGMKLSLRVVWTGAAGGTAEVRAR
jgi:hypothetical protein